MCGHPPRSARGRERSRAPCAHTCRPPAPQSLGGHELARLVCEIVSDHFGVQGAQDAALYISFDLDALDPGERLRAVGFSTTCRPLVP